MSNLSKFGGRFLHRMICVALFLILAPALFAQQAVRVSCSSKPGERQSCPADTSHGVILAKSSGEAPCILGKSWGYDDREHLGFGWMQW